jgi:L-fuculose-phosphate aldolase
MESVKQHICKIGQRIYGKGFAAANEGNISVRVSESEVLCTPTRICKGFMDPEDICSVNMDGIQTAGKRKKTSEILLHLEIYRRRPDVKSVVHCHPPHATAFGVAREPIPTCVLPEPDIFLGEVPIANYATPNSQELADSILPFVQKTNVIVLANHGTVSYEADLETAFWLTEILDAYCRILGLAKQLGNVEQLTAQQGRELLELRKAWGFPDPRFENNDQSDLRKFPLFRDTWEAANIHQRAFQSRMDDHDRVQSTLKDDHLDLLVEKIVDRILEKLNTHRP